jgi:hypothetical protein
MAASTRNWTRITAWLLLALEMLWAAYWLGGMLFLQITTDDTNHGSEYRFAHIVNAFHAFSPIALVGAMVERHEYSPLTLLFFCFTIAIRMRGASKWVWLAGPLRLAL